MFTVKRSFQIILVLAFSVACLLPAQQAPWSKRMADATMQRWPDGQIVVNGKAMSDWAYDKNLLLAGFAAVWQNTGDPSYYRYIQRSMDRLVADDGSIASYKEDELSSDEIALGRQLLLLYGRTRKEKYYKAATIIRSQIDIQPRTPSGGFWHKKRYPNQMWLDGPYMVEPFYAQYAAMFQRPKDFDDIAHQFVLIEARTRDAKTGLLYHGWDETRQMSWANKDTGRSPIFWARAIGWYAMALVDTLPYFPPDHPGRAQLLAILNRLAPAIAGAQDPETGLWYQVIDKRKEPGNFPESSASCMLVYALQKGVRLGYLDPKYQQNAQRGYDGILKHFVKADADGKLTVTDTNYSSSLLSTLTPENSYRYYINSPTGPSHPKGIGAFLLAGSEMEIASTATMFRGKTVLLDAWFNSQKRKNAAGQEEYFHYKWNDLADPGYFTFGRIFRSYGAKTETLYDRPTAAQLQKADIYIIVSPDIPFKNPNPHYMTDADAQEIANWVKAGGVLAIMQNDSVNSEFENFNKLSDKFGMHFNAVRFNEVEGSKFETGKISIPAGNEILHGPRTLFMKEVSTITVSKPARVIHSENFGVVMALAKFGKGTVFGMTDPWLYNEYTDGTKLPPEYENYAGGKEFVRWLLQQTKTRTNKEAR